MNLKNNKGYVVEDIFISIIIIMVFIPTVFGVIYNIKKSNAEIERKVYAINIAKNYLDKKELLNDENIDSVVKDEKDKKDVQYKVTIAKDTTTENKINIIVEYPIGKDTGKIEMSKIYK